MLLLQMQDDIFRLLAAACLVIICRHAAEHGQCESVADADMEAATGFLVRLRLLHALQVTVAVGQEFSGSAVVLLRVIMCRGSSASQSSTPHLVCSAQP